MSSWFGRAALKKNRGGCYIHVETVQNSYDITPILKGGGPPPFENVRCALNVFVGHSGETVHELNFKLQCAFDVAVDLFEKVYMNLCLMSSFTLYIE